MRKGDIAGTACANGEHFGEKGAVAANRGWLRCPAIPFSCSCRVRLRARGALSRMAIRSVVLSFWATSKASLNSRDIDQCPAAGPACRLRRRRPLDSVWASLRRVPVTTDPNAAPGMTVCTTISACQYLDHGDRMRGNCPAADDGEGCSQPPIEHCGAVQAVSRP
jgi:hypothetical protein